ncbi:MAG: phosphoribosylamine--glycine ligase [Gammaproteobacteria bacterium]|nr:phosphoribosylamine--glycine ligase [Gammaproteobacteria bacterium]|tara:strand:- start:8707 stop:9990 length:1284 start_codon:yes stop_codon:yes gene_type:complete
MKVLVIGSGGREHALAWRAAASTRVHKVFVAPGNAGTARSRKVENVDISVSDTDELITFAHAQSVDLTIVGPEDPLVGGIVDRFQSEGLRIFGPTAAAAQLEGSKTFTKEFLQRYQIPTGASESFTDFAAAKAYIQAQGAPIVVKADGLAAGKGVVLAQTVDEAVAAANSMLNEGRFGDAGTRVLIEEFLTGEEASFIVVSDGTNIAPMASAQDHKARDDGDGGPNTGGMGAYTPAPVIDGALHARIMETIIQPTINGMAADGQPFVGFLFAGLMVSEDGEPYVLEFNCRMGDPETQAIMMRLKSDLVGLCESAIEGTLDQHQPEWDERVALGVVMAAGGYPEEYAKGDVISGLDDTLDDTMVFHAGTKNGPSGTQTNGGRVLCVCALGDSVAEAQARAYERVAQIQWDNVYFRRDIGYRAVARERG